MPDGSSRRLAASRQEAKQLELGDVGVLVLVDEDDAEALARAPPHRLVVAQETRGQPYEVAEVDIARLSEPVLVERVDPAQARIGEGGGEVGRVGLEAEVLRARDGLDHARALAPRVLRHRAVKERGLVVVVVDGEVGIEPDRGRVATEEPGPEGVEGAHDRARAGGLDRHRSVAHLAGGLVREGHGEDGLGLDAALADEIGDLGGDHPGLARARAGEDEEAASFVADGCELLGVEHGKIGREGSSSHSSARSAQGRRRASKSTPFTARTRARRTEPGRWLAADDGEPVDVGSLVPRPPQRELFVASEARATCSSTRIRSRARRSAPGVPA